MPLSKFTDELPPSRHAFRLNISFLNCSLDWHGSLLRLNIQTTCTQEWVSVVQCQKNHWSPPQKKPAKKLQCELKTALKLCCRSSELVQLFWAFSVLQLDVIYYEHLPVAPRAGLSRSNWCEPWLGRQTDDLSTFRFYVGGLLDEQTEFTAFHHEDEWCNTIHVLLNIGKTWKDLIRNSTQFKSSNAWGEMYSWLVLSTGWRHCWILPLASNLWSMIRLI